METEKRKKEMNGNWTIRPLQGTDAGRVRSTMTEHWGDRIVVVHGTVYHPETLPGFVAEADGEWLGLVTVHMAGEHCEVVTLDSFREGTGIGTALMNAARKFATDNGCRRIWLVTTNDNLRALGFYQKLGYRLTAVRPGAIAASRQIKPAIPEIGMNGIPIRDELELELSLEV